MKKPLDGEVDCVFNGGNTSNQSESSIESCDDDTLGITVDTIGESTTPATHIRRIKSTGNLSDVATLGHKFCYKNLEVIRDKERLARTKRIEAEKLKKENCSKSEFLIFFLLLREDVFVCTFRGKSHVAISLRRSVN